MPRSVLALPLLAGLTLAALLAWPCSEPLQAQTGSSNSPAALTTEDIYGPVAKKLLSTERAQYSYKHFSSYEFFPLSRKLQQPRAAWEAYFEEVNASEAEAGRLKLTGEGGASVLNVTGSGAQVGDIVRMDHPGMKPLVLVHAGQHRFPDMEQSCSFFIYPYSTHAGLELNTMPPRWNQRLLKKLYSIADDTSLGLGDTRFASLHYQPGLTIRWLQQPRILGSLFVPTRWMKSGTTWQVLRPRAQFALKKRLEYHPQQRSTSCVFAAHVNVLNYLGLLPEGKTPEQWEKDLLDREIDNPPTGSDAEKVAALVRKLDGKNKRPLDDVRSWLSAAYTTRVTAADGFHWKPLLRSPTEEHFRALLQLHLAQDEPVIATLKTREGVPWIEVAPEPDANGSLTGYTRLDIANVGKGKGGHAVVITGLRWDSSNNEWLVYFVCSLHTQHPSKNGHWVTRLKDLHEALLAWNGRSYDLADPDDSEKRRPITQLFKLDR